MSTDRVIRPESHEIDTAARREVPRALPRAWEHRETTGRDYGVDMQVELFSGGVALGTWLFLQVKGTTKVVGEVTEDLLFEAPVGLLRYAEKVPTPVLLALCPVDAQVPVFYYLWLQEYIRVVLDFDNESWRENIESVRVRIPKENRMPGKEGQLAFIASYPKRQREWAQLARVQHELEDYLRFEEEDRERLCGLFREALGFGSLFGDDSWDWAKNVKEYVLEAGLAIAQRLARGEPYSRSDYAVAMGFESQVEREEDQELIEEYLWAGLKGKVDQLAAVLDQANSVRYSRTLWEVEALHDF
jgi:hypothetical protein